MNKLFGLLLLMGILSMSMGVAFSNACTGFTPGFWKHNIQVRLDLTNGAYSAFVGGPRDGSKPTDALMDTFLTHINADHGTSYTLAQLLAFLQLPGSNSMRTTVANWFNHAAGYGPY